MRVEAVPVPTGASVPGGHTNAYVVGETDALLVDPGGRTDDLDAALARRSVAHLAVTHTHADHVGGVAGYAADLDATVWARAGRTGAFEAATGVSPHRTMREGTTVGPASVIETPGHASDHVAFVLDDEAVSGDVAFASGSAAVTGDLRAYLTSLRRLRTRGFTRLHPGHGPPVDDPEATIERLLRHRRDRERRVLRAVRAGADTPEAIVDAAYDEDPGAARPLAVTTVRAHLRKLDVEGSLAWDGERASPR